MRIRYFASAAAAAGTKEEFLDLATIEESSLNNSGTETASAHSSVTLGELLDYLSAHRAPETVKETVGSDGQPVLQRIPSLARVLGQSSFLINGKNERSRDRVLKESDMVDILPPFAGG
ncbi:MoaD/ThiS family protein [Neomicrococcus aestuarii]|uniref:Molybdopterin synthase sulfur carrier subunit n=1 Tax=Neomicrococcus aestuarii TaxID=556325 RepID=A0A1L2ZMH0_9MICC|nr:MoaD/ThiS family protein [Neomicrococcus aestuarii]APF40329.1 hypothetical protein BHE16_04070 [Neomicrococcus aestuarii]